MDAGRSVGQSEPDGGFIGRYRLDSLQLTLHFLRAGLRLINRSGRLVELLFQFRHNVTKLAELCLYGGEDFPDLG